MEIISKGGLQDAPPDGVGGPRWVARLDDGAVIVGRPSWMGNSGPTVMLPNDEPHPMSDWRRLMTRCNEARVRIKSLALFCNGRWFRADDDAGAYGYFEAQVVSYKGIGKRKVPRSGIQALAICWPKRDERNGRMRIKVLKIHATGLYEEWWRDQWLPCMIGPPEAEQAFKDEGTLNRSVMVS